MYKKLILIVIIMSSNLLAQQDVEDWTRGSTVIVPVTDAWTNTNCDLESGDKVTIFANGFATTNINAIQRFHWWCGPEGVQGNITQLPIPDVAAYSLIAKIGSGGTPFYIGGRLEFIANNTGDLYLGYNDNQFSDNYGFYVAFIICTSNGNSISSQPQNVEDFSLLQNYPNPFNPSTTIEYEVDIFNHVKLNIFNSKGQLIKELVNRPQSPGIYRVLWDGTDESGNKMSSGNYYYQVIQEDKILTKKALLLK